MQILALFTFLASKYLISFSCLSSLLAEVVDHIVLYRLGPFSLFLGIRAFDTPCTAIPSVTFRIYANQRDS